MTPPDRWSFGVLGAEGGSPTKLRLPFLPEPLAAATTTPSSVPPPQTSLEVGADGRTTLTAGFHPGAARLIVSIWSATPVVDVRFNGIAARYTPKGGKPTAFTLEAGEWGKLTWAAPDGFRMTFHTKDPTRIRVDTAEVYDRWLSSRPLPPMPAADQPWDIAGSSLVLGVATGIRQ